METGAPVNTLAVTVFPRLHITLLSMGADGYRRNGGIGFAIAGPTTTLIAERATANRLSDERTSPLLLSELIKYSAWLTEVTAHTGWGCARFVIRGDAAPHRGLGTGTGIRLAAVEALALLSGCAPAREELIKLSGRGGASGIGISTYFDGGLVFDVGVSGSDRPFLSSESSAMPQVLPARLGRVDMPQWNLGICIPQSLRVLSIEEEQQFFDRTCPIRNEAVYEATYHALFGCYSGALEGNLHTFSAAVRAIQQCEWKRAERALYGADLLKIENALYEAGALCVGMSSLGPALFFLSEEKMVAPQTDGAGPLHLCYLNPVAMRNSGRVVHA